MEGLNIPALLLGYVAVLVFAVTTLAALGVLVAKSARLARIVFAGGLLGANVLAAVAVLCLFIPGFQRDIHALAAILAAVSVLLSGIGPFLASLRSGGTAFALAVACAALSLMLAGSPMLGGDWSVKILGDGGLKLLELGLPLLVLFSPLPAIASLLIGLLWPDPQQSAANSSG